MSTLINESDNVKEFLETTYGKANFMLSELEDIAKKYNCIIVMDELEDLKPRDTYVIKGYYRNIKLIHPMSELKNYKGKDGVCTRTSDQGVMCVTEEGSRDLHIRYKNLLIVALHCETYSDKK